METARFFETISDDLDRRILDSTDIRATGVIVSFAWIPDYDKVIYFRRHLQNSIFDLITLS